MWCRWRTSKKYDNQIGTGRNGYWNAVNAYIDYIAQTIALKKLLSVATSLKTYFKINV